MQLKIKRSQRDGGVISKTAIFCLDARVEFTGEEKRYITRYKLGREVIYNSEAQLRLLERSHAQQDGSIRGNLKSLATAAFAFTKLHVTINSLEQGQHIECKSLEELLGAEDAIMTACQNLKTYLDAAATFDGREVLFDFSTGAPEPIAAAIAPSPALVVDPLPLPHPPLPPPEPVVEAMPEPEGDGAANEFSDADDSFNTTDYEGGAYRSDIYIEDGAKKVLIFLAVAVVVVFLFSKAISG